MKRVKVGLDQWVIAGNTSTTELLTDGLSGCVALVLESQNSFCLAHVFSGCNQSNWESYKKELELPLVILKKHMPLRAALCYSDDNKTKLVELLETWLKSVGISVIDTYKTSGVRVSYHSGMHGVEIFKKEEDNQDYYIKKSNYVSVSNAAPYIENWGELSKIAEDVE